jgi:spore coat protein U-like protein
VNSGKGPVPCVESPEKRSTAKQNVTRECLIVFICLFTHPFRSISFGNLSSESFVLNATAQFNHLCIAGIIPAAGIVTNINLNQSAGEGR